MKRKFTTLLFTLLLAVGWTSSAFAQAYTFTEAQAKAWTYTWFDAQGGRHDNTDPTLKVTDPYQMYYLLRHIYMDQRFPGPHKSAYKADGVTRERDVYYGGIESGWDIPGNTVGNTSTVSPVGNIVITTSSGYVGIVSITVTDYNSGTILTSWTTSSSQPSLPSTWTPSKTPSFNGAGYDYSLYLSSGGTITIPSSLFNGSTKVKVTVRSRIDATNYSGTLSVNGEQTSSSLTTTSTNYEWTISGTTTGGDTGIGDITINGNQAACIRSITVSSGNTTLFNWAMATNSMNWTPGMVADNWNYYPANRSISVADGYPITLQGWLFAGYSNVTVTINAYYNTNYGTSGTLTVNNVNRTVTASGYSNATNYTWSLSSKSFAGPTRYQADQYLPTNEGYTALIVKLRNNLYIKSDEPGFPQQCFYNSRDSIISYFRRNVESIQLLTDGLRIGQNDKVGTVFNAPSDMYNKFFFLSKGQARQKSDIVIQEEVYREHLLGENVPFAQLFEQFSPTGGETGSDITDFYSEMMQGKVYRIVHDCLSVIQNQHEFSMSGHSDTTRYKMTGMNFFIPDHRLQYWELTDTVKGYQWNSTTETYDRVVLNTYTVDGRDMNPYQPASPSKTNNPSTFYKTPSSLAVWYAQYDTAQHAPLVGIYLLSLEAEASKVADYNESNRYYNVDLDWTSSLNEMSGGTEIPQTYIIYQVVTDSVTGVKSNVPIDTVQNITELRLDTLYEQQQHSYSLTYVIQGSPTGNTHPGFIAWSNEATVIIPGYDDFMILHKHHFEADFNVNYTVPDGKNYYRNYLYPENDIANGITRESILGGYDSFLLYRTSADGKVPVAKLKLGVNSQNQVVYKITYFDENEDYTWRNDIDIDAIIRDLVSKMNNN